ncbi:MAG: hypothetical protein JRH01_08430 [Deltaproteobacteria bacterium]|nr:hypothetical protein [Deltaproteobacteria bacterium]
MSDATTVLCTYRVRSDCEAEFLSLLEGHWPKLRELALVTAEPALRYRGLDGEGRPFVVEIFSWTSDDAVERAHAHPEVLAIWEPLGGLCESREGLPGLEFPHVERLA